MRRSIVILVLSVIVIVLSGCEKIKTELERRHLRSEMQKTSTPAALDELKTFNNKQNDAETPSTRKQIVLRIDLPTDEKIQIRLIKSPVQEAAPELGAPPKETSPKETLKESAPPKEEKPLDKSEKSVESDREKSTEKTDSKDEKSKPEIKTDLDQEPEPEKETHRETPLPPDSVPTVVVPGREIEPPPTLPDEQVKKSLSRPEPSEMAPAEKAVGIAIGITPEEVSPDSREPLNAAPAANKPLSSNPWAIPNAEYPIGYY